MTGAQVSYVGLHAKDAKPRVGVTLDKPLGKNNGSVGGHAYFACNENHGILCPPEFVSLNQKAAVPVALKPNPFADSPQRPKQNEANPFGDGPANTAPNPAPKAKKVNPFDAVKAASEQNVAAKSNPFSAKKAWAKAVSSTKVNPFADEPNTPKAKKSNPFADKPAPGDASSSQDGEPSKGGAAMAPNPFDGEGESDGATTAASSTKGMVTEGMVTTGMTAAPPTKLEDALADTLARKTVLEDCANIDLDDLPTSASRLTRSGTVYSNRSSSAKTTEEAAVPWDPFSAPIQGSSQLLPAALVVL